MKFDDLVELLLEKQVRLKASNLQDFEALILLTLKHNKSKELNDILSLWQKELKQIQKSKKILKVRTR